MGKVVWQYSPEWQKLMGIFEKRGDSLAKVEARGAEQAPDDGDFDWEDEVDEVTGHFGETFVPARDKSEAVKRISNLTTGRPQALGPGSTEKKSVLTDLAQVLGMDSNVSSLSKPRLGQAIAHSAGFEWSDDCWSEGSTITLVGLNRLLEVAESRLEPATPWHRDPATESRDILEFLAKRVGNFWDGQQCVEEMRDARSRDWAKSEWPGWYFEFRVLGSLFAEFGGGPVKAPNNTVFDFKANKIWDLKTHSAGNDTVILNDQSAIEWALRNGGLGFVILHGTPAFDPAFKPWHDALKRAEGKVPATRSHPRKFERRLKSAFTPELLESYYFPNEDAWHLAMEVGAIKSHAQGRQVSGHSRAPKFEMNLAKARTEWLQQAVLLHS